MIEWSLGVRDPSPRAWVIVVIYLLGALACVRAFMTARTERRGDEGRFWIGLACLLGFLALNKQLDFQTLLTEIGRASAKELGLFPWRRQIQRVFILLLMLCAATGFSMLIWRLRRADRSVGLAIAGAAVILAFILGRAATFSHASMFFGAAFEPHSIERFRVEFAGIMLVLLSALWYPIRVRPAA